MRIAKFCQEMHGFRETQIWFFAGFTHLNM
jgi:hypothetical protein